MIQHFLLFTWLHFNASQWSQFVGQLTILQKLWSDLEMNMQFWSASKKIDFCTV